MKCGRAIVSLLILQRGRSWRAGASNSVSSLSGVRSMRRFGVSEERRVRSIKDRDARLRKIDNFLPSRRKSSTVLHKARQARLARLIRGARPGLQRQKQE